MQTRIYAGGEVEADVYPRDAGNTTGFGYAEAEDGDEPLAVALAAEDALVVE